LVSVRISSKRSHLAQAEIDQPLVEAVALGAPAVLLHQHVVVAPPALVVALQAVEHVEHAEVDRGHGDAVLVVGADVGDAHLQGREARRGPHVPPQLAGVLDQAARRTRRAGRT
jgi:hypothetical protein